MPAAKEWNAKNLTGWVDVPLSDKGRAGGYLQSSSRNPAFFPTSGSRRCRVAPSRPRTWLDAKRSPLIPVERNWRPQRASLRCAQGKNKKEIRDEYGEERTCWGVFSSDVGSARLSRSAPSFRRDQDPRRRRASSSHERVLPVDVASAALLGRGHCSRDQDRQDRRDRRGIGNPLPRAIASSTWMRSPEDIVGVNIPYRHLRWCNELDEETLAHQEAGGTWILRP